MLILFAALLLAAATPDAGPPLRNGVYVEQGACPGESCDTSLWWRSTAAQPLYKAPGSSKVIGYVHKGDRAAVLDTEYWTQPMRGVVLRKADPFQAGDVLYTLVPEGEGYMSVWRRGEILTLAPDEEYPPAGEPVVKWDEAPRPDDVWWVKLRTSRRVIGWVPSAEHFECVNKLAGDANCVEAPRRAAAKTKP